MLASFRFFRVFAAATLLLTTGCDEPKPAAQPKPSTTSAATASGQPQADTNKAGGAKAKPSSASGSAKTEIREVSSKEWIPKVGPKLPPGSTVAHKVFAGWPKADSLFVITKEKDQYKARVFDDRVYMTASWGIPDAKGKSINAVSFFDADGDGKADAVVIATFDKGGENRTYNGMFKWTGTSIEPMTALAEKVGVHDSIADIRKKLGK